MCASGVMATMDDYVSSHFNVKRSFFTENVFFSTKFIPLVSYVSLYLFSVIHVSVDIKTVVSQRKTFSFFFFLSKSPGGHTILRQKRQVPFGLP